MRTDKAPVRDDRIAVVSHQSNHSRGQRLRPCHDAGYDAETIHPLAEGDEHPESELVDFREAAKRAQPVERWSICTCDLEAVLSGDTAAREGETGDQLDAARAIDDCGEEACRIALVHPQTAR